MSFQHQKLASGNWNNMSLFEQMANIGSEVNRVIIWKNKNNLEYSQKAFVRALELLELSIKNKNNKARLKELTRLNELLVDYFWGKNQHSSSDQLWQKYFHCFNYASRINT